MIYLKGINYDSDIDWIEIFYYENIPILIRTEKNHRPTFENFLKIFLGKDKFTYKFVHLNKIGSTQYYKIIYE